MSDRIKVVLIAGALLIGVYLSGCGNTVDTNTNVQGTTGYSGGYNNGYGYTGGYGGYGGGY